MQCPREHLRRNHDIPIEVVFRLAFTQMGDLSDNLSERLTSDECRLFTLVCEETVVGKFNDPAR